MVTANDFQMGTVYFKTDTKPLATDRRATTPPMIVLATPEKCQRLLHRFGWSPGETAWRCPDGRRYRQVDANRAGHVIIATGPSQAWAWALAVRMAGRLVREGVV